MEVTLYDHKSATSSKKPKHATSSRKPKKHYYDEGLKKSKSRSGCCSCFRCCCRIINLAITLCMLGAGGFLLWNYLGRPSPDDVRDGLQDIWNNRTEHWDDFTDVLDNLGNVNLDSLIGDKDPFLSNNDTLSWKSYGSGLELEMVNALDETWQDEYREAVYDWDNGIPDALTLSSETQEPDFECINHIDDKQKVCNGNFGDTGWLGINEILKDSKTQIIISSIAKMNEYYLRNADHAERQYTMCHEIGHGFGLPHTDESFTNPSLGNCLDYTHTPSDNMHPDEMNFNRLAEIYGTVDDRQRNRRTAAALRQRSTSSLSSGSRKLLQEEHELAQLEMEESSSWKELVEQKESLWSVLHQHEKGVFIRRQLRNTHHVLEVRMLFSQDITHKREKS